MNSALASLACLVLAVGTASAQQRMFALATDAGATALWEARLDAGRIADPRLVSVVTGEALGPPVVTAGGQLVAWQVRTIGGSVLAVLERETGRTQTLPGVGGLGVSDPTRPRLFVTAAGQIASLTAAGSLLVPNTTGLIPAAMSADGRRLYALRPSQGTAIRYDLVGIDTSSWATLGSVSLGEGLQQVSPHPDNESVWVVSNPFVVPPRPMLRRLALPSGSEMVAIPLPAGDSVLSINHRLIGSHLSLRRVAVSLSWNMFPPGTTSRGEVRIYDSETGVELAVVDTEGSSVDELDAGRGTIQSFAQSTSPRPYLTCGEGAVRTVSLASGQVLSRTPLGTTACLRVAFAAPPTAPVLNPALVSSDRSVTLTWASTPHLTTGFTVEAGSGPGLADIATLPVSGSQTLRVPNVPTGLYYVRVLARNYIGASVPSNELVISVP